MLQSDKNEEEQLMSVVNSGYDKLSENNEPERNAAESMVLLTSRSAQNRLILSLYKQK